MSSSSSGSWGSWGGSTYRWGLSVVFGENTHLLIEKIAPGVRERSEVKSLLLLLTGHLHSC